MRIGSLCTGAGQLDMAAAALFPDGMAYTAWACETDPDASVVIDHHICRINHGDITAVDWRKVEPVDVLVAGYPCQDLSNAGKRAGIEGAKSGIWRNVADAIRVLRPRLVLLENVRAHLARGFGRVLGDLAELGYDAQWTCLRASDVGACHQRDRVFVVAWNQDDAMDCPTHSPHSPDRLASWAVRGRGIHHGANGYPAPAGPAGSDDDRRGYGPAFPRRSWHGQGVWTVRTARPGNEAFLALDSQLLQRGGATNQPDVGWPRLTSAGAGGGGFVTPSCTCAGPRSALGGLATPTDPDREPVRVEPQPVRARLGAPVVGGDREDALNLLPTPRATDAAKGGPNQRGSSGDLTLPSAVVRLLPTPCAGAQTRAEGRTNHDGWTLSDVAFADRWAQYGPAIRRWEHVLGRPAPEPTVTGKRGGQRLSGAFTEWMMGWPEGWVSGLVDNNAAVRISGNGVVPQQAFAAYVDLTSHLLATIPSSSERSA